MELWLQIIIYLVPAVIIAYMSLKDVEKKSDEAEN